MTELSENEIQRTIIEFLRLRGWFVIRMNAGKVRHNVSMCPPGTPDLFAISRRGKNLWIEVKRPGCVLSEDQENMHEFLRMREQEVVTAFGTDEVKVAIGE